jgi:hypothetical protein
VSDAVEGVSGVSGYGGERRGKILKTDNEMVVEIWLINK